MKKKRKLKFGFFFVLLTSVLIMCSLHYVTALLCAVTLHELGHIIAAKLLDIELRELKIGIFGAALSCSDTLYSYKKEMILCAAGPAVNFLSALVVYQFVGITQITETFLLSSLSLGILNLLPINGFDGGRIFSAFLCLFLSLKTVNVIVKFVSFLFIFTLWCLSVYLLIRACASLSLFVFSLSLFTKIFLPDSV